MTTLHRIALLGFSAFERNTLGSYFRLASTREPRYEQVQLLSEADFVVADADHAPSVQLVQAVERMPETVFVGAKPPDGAIAWMGRPIDPMRVLRELDVMAARRLPVPARADALAEAAGRRRTVIQPVRPQRPLPPAELLLQPAETLDLTLPDLPDPPDVPHPAPAALPLPATAAAASAQAPAAAPAPAVAPAPAPSASALAAAAPVVVPAVAASAVRASASMPAAAAKPAALRPAVPQRAPGAALPSTALLVDDSDIALRFLQKKLAPFGLVTDCVSHSAAAIERLARRRYDFVFLDMELGERSPLDGLGLCQHIKREPAASNVVMVTAHHTELDRVRGALAGCDGFLGKPLDEDELALYLARFGVMPAANAGGMPS
ncbi:MAG: response regulator [Burkholderiales bacterium]|nr:response regulator [Burkholderiales bacterium]